MKTYIFEVHYSDGLHCTIAVRASTRTEAEAELNEQVQVGKIGYYLYQKQYEFNRRFS